MLLSRQQRREKDTLAPSSRSVLGCLKGQLFLLDDGIDRPTSREEEWGGL
jgi:hypothetical protein